MSYYEMAEEVKRMDYRSLMLLMSDIVSVLNNRYAKENKNEKNVLSATEKRAKLKEYMGSAAEMWKGLDAMEYQREMREDREIEW